jgi:hypothetical protein
MSLLQEAPPEVGSERNPRATLVHTARFEVLERLPGGNSAEGPRGTGSGIPVPFAPQLSPNVQGGAWMSYLAAVNGNGKVNFNLRLPNVSLLLPNHPWSSFDPDSAKVEVHAAASPRLRRSPEKIYSAITGFVAGQVAEIDTNMILQLNQGPGAVGRNWSVLVEAHGWFFSTSRAKSLAPGQGDPGGTGGGDQPEPTSGGYGVLTIEIELPLTVGPAPSTNLP